MSGTVAENWHTLGGRLRWAINQQPASGRKRGLRLFQARMKKYAPAMPGTSLSAIQGYLRDDGEPSLAFVRQAAVLLSVREPWLACGDGMPTKEKDSGDAELFSVSTAVYDALGVPTKVEGGAERFFGSAVWAPIARHTALQLYQRHQTWSLLMGGGVSEEDPDIRWQRAVEETALAIAAPLKALGVEADQLELSEVGDYVSALSITLQQAIARYVPGSLYAPTDNPKED